MIPIESRKKVKGIETVGIFRKEIFLIVIQTMISWLVMLELISKEYQLFREKGGERELVQVETSHSRLKFMMIAMLTSRMTTLK